MKQSEFEGARYRDDRMYVMKLVTDFINESDGAIVALSANGPLVLVTYRNVEGLPATRVGEFASLGAAIDYIKDVEPSCPRVSLGGQTPIPPLNWSQHLDWLKSAGLRSAAEGATPNPQGFAEGDNPRGSIYSFEFRLVKLFLTHPPSGQR